MVSNQPPPFPAFAGLGTEATDEDLSEQPIVGADDAAEDARESGASPLSDAFDRLTPDHPHHDSDGVAVGEADQEADVERSYEG
jgi:hypothetical protein